MKGIFLLLSGVLCIAALEAQNEAEGSFLSKCMDESHMDLNKLRDLDGKYADDILSEPERNLFCCLFQPFITEGGELNSKKIVDFLNQMYTKSDNNDVVNSVVKTCESKKTTNLRDLCDKTAPYIQCVFTGIRDRLKDVPQKSA
ncbi:uncharacterized protein LOC116348895 [Contarinia nasturtii]|uniref:uncharacterized protein LOC116348895 n=1 Tax=Contarinia nasturtii TaxID=265458 RepID=UPI0012D3DC39|nr:uncharacterized protein LOC116348895 [Contarinia nasturtii]